jgi:hypothetical protein
MGFIIGLVIGLVGGAVLELLFKPLTLVQGLIKTVVAKIEAIAEDLKK